MGDISADETNMELCADCRDCYACEGWEDREEARLADENYAEEVEHAAMFSACEAAASSTAGEEQSGEGGRVWGG